MIRYLFLLTVSAIAQTNNDVLWNREPLLQVPYANLPLGSVSAKGWLLTQLENQAKGLTGNAEEVIPELTKENGWLGGSGEGWEKAPYYLKGLVTLAYTTKDQALKNKAQVWIDSILSHQQDDGFYGPGKREEIDWWPRMVVNWMLRDYYEATGDQRVIPFLSKYFHYMKTALPKRPLFDWGKARAGDEMDTVIWLYNHTGEKELLEVANLLRTQAWNWIDIYSNNTFQHHGSFYTFHNVNVPQAAKFPVVSYELTKNANDVAALSKGWSHLMRDHGMSFGMSSGTEFLSGLSPSQGTEMCSFVEQMLSFYIATRITGKAEWMDRAEKIAFNGMPAGLTKDFKQYQYYTLPNQVIAKHGNQGYNQEYVDGICLGPHSGCHCCCYNLHMGYPKLTQHSWMASKDGGLAAMIYAPTELKTKIQGRDVIISETTNYPFDEKITLTVLLDKEMKFPLHLRIPSWCDAAAITVNGEAARTAAANTFLVLDRTWQNGDVVTLDFPMKIKLVPGVLRSVSVERGPLLYSLMIGEKLSEKNHEAHGFPDLECVPTTAWNYALTNDIKNFRVEKSTMPANPFLLENTPLHIKAKAKKIPEWTLAANEIIALDPPLSPVSSSQAEEEITLVPFGATTLHIANFPWLGTAQPAPKKFVADFNDGTMNGFVLYGGNCSVRDQQLTLSPGNNYLKAVVPTMVCKNFTVSADLTIGDRGDAGFMFRASKIATGPDANLGYYAGISPEKQQLLVGLHDGKSWHPLPSPSVKLEANHSYHLTIEGEGDRFRIYLGKEKKLIHEFQDSTFPEGTIGIREYAAKQFQAESFSVETR